MSLDDAVNAFNNAHYSENTESIKAQNTQEKEQPKQENNKTTLNWKYNPDNYTPEQEIDSMDENTAPAQTQPAQEQTTVEATQPTQEQIQALRAINEQLQEINKETQERFTKIDSLRHKFDTHKKVTKTEYIAGLFARGGVTVIAGASGVGKTTFIQRVFYDLSLGGVILNGFYTEDKPKKGLVFAGELGEKGLTERAQEFEWHSDKNFVEIIDQKKYASAKIEFTLDTKQGKQNLTHIISTTPGLDYIIFDSFGMFISGQENDNNFLRDVFKDLMTFADAYNIAIIIVHHNRKRLSSEQSKPLTLDDLIGGNAISRYAHRIIVIERNNELKANVVTCLKSWGEYFKQFSYAKKPGFYGGTPYLEINLDLSGAEIIPTGKKKNNTATPSRADNQRAIIKAVLKARGKSPVSTQELRDILGIQKDDENANNTLNQVLMKLYQDKEIIKPDGARGLYTLPDSSQPDTEK